MPETRTCTWPGKSGRKYTYFVYSLPFSFEEGQPGNFIYAKLVNGRFHPVHVGHGDLGKAVILPFKQQPEGATHIHVHLNYNEKERCEEKEDILLCFPTTFPVSCVKADAVK